MKRVIVLFVAIAMVLGALGGCSQTSPAASNTASTSAVSTAAANAAATTSTAAASGELKLLWYQTIGIDTLFENPWHDLQSLYPYMVFDALISQKSDGTFVPKLAAEYNVSSDGLTYTFKIRDGVKWQDGQAFTADDVAWTLYAGLADPNSNIVSSRLKEIVGASDVKSGKATTLSGVTVDGNTVTVKLSSPDNTFLYGMAMCYILPKHLLGNDAPADIDKDQNYWSKPIGTGAYKIDQVKFPDYFTVVANDGYWGTKPGIPKAIFTSYNTGGNDATVSDLIAGNLDFAYGNALNDVKVANNITAKNADVVSKVVTSNYVRFLTFNLEKRSDGNNKADLKKEEVRQAFNLLLDKSAMAALYGGQAVALSTMANPASSWYDQDIPAFKRDVTTAESMLKEAGYDFSKTIDIAYYYTDQTTSDLMALITQNFAEAGIKVKTALLSGDLSTLIYKTANFDMIYGAYSGASTPNEIYQKLCKSSAYTYIGEDDKRGQLFDNLYSTFLAANDTAAQKAAGDQLQALGYKEAYIIPVYSLNTTFIYNSKHVSIPDDLFQIDNQQARDWEFDKWSLVG